MDNSKWLAFYQSDRNNTKKVFIKAMTSDGEHFFFSDYKDWFKVKEHCSKNGLFVQDLHLQFRSNKCIVDVADADGVYLIRAVMGSFGAKTRNYFTVGVIRGDTVYKSMYLIPELIEEKKYEDTLSNCFEEAIIYSGVVDETKENGEK